MEWHWGLIALLVIWIGLAIWWVGHRRTQSAAIYSGFFLIGVGLAASFFVPMWLGYRSNESGQAELPEAVYLTNTFIVVASVGANFLAGAALASIGHAGIGRIFGWAPKASAIPRLVHAGTQLHREARFSRINWQVVTIPRVRSGFDEFAQRVRSAGYFEPLFHVLSADNAKRMLVLQGPETWTDSVTIRFGSRPIAAEPVVAVPGVTSVLAEDGASLVFSQALSGHVAAIVLLPKGHDEKQRQHFLVGAWGNPNDMKGSDVTECLNALLDVDIKCSMAVFPNTAAARLLATLRARDQKLRDGGSWLWTEFK